MNAPAFPSRIGFGDALDILVRVANTAVLPVESVAPAQALGRILAEDVHAVAALPAFDNAAMDGFALRAADLADGGSLELAGEQFAGMALPLQAGQGRCIRITTGAVLPQGADAVAMKEDTDVEGSRVRFRTRVVAGQHVRRAGEDVRQGERILVAGDVLAPAALSLAVAVGRDSLRVHRRPTVALFTTGDELRPAGAPLAPGEIHDSNRVLLQALLQAEGYHPVAWPVLPDDPARIAAALGDAAAAFDVVITCGGVSAGEKDHLPAWLAAQGSVHFWKVRMRPGMPLLAGRVGDCQVLCLPGNPVSVFATWLTLGRPFLDALQGRRLPRPRLRACLSLPVHKRHERLEFLRGSLHCDATGRLQVVPNPADGSHRLRAAAEADCLLVLPEGAGAWGEGEVVEVLPLSPSIGG
jgi:molybdopterin molybdotransferase